MIRDWLAGLGLPALAQDQVSIVELIDVASGARLLSLKYPSLASYEFSTGGETLGILDAGLLTLWDVPPPKSLRWFTLVAGVLALPPAWLARRRARELRKNPNSGSREPRR